MLPIPGCGLLDRHHDVGQRIIQWSPSISTVWSVVVTIVVRFFLTLEIWAQPGPKGFVHATSAEGERELRSQRKVVDL